MQKVFSLFVFLFIICSSISITPIEKKELIKSEIVVEVKGAIKNPGLFHCSSFCTVSDLLNKLTLEDNYDLSTLNLQTVLKDKDVLVIPFQQDIPLISINTADLKALCTLDGIGETTAQLIIDYRNQNGFFQTLNDLMNVKGIGQKKFDKIKDKICL